MKHNLKLPDGTIKSVDCKLGSGIVDKNGKEIFEGDKVKHDGQVYVVEFTNGHFGLTDDDRAWVDLDLCTNSEVIGHADD